MTPVLEFKAAELELDATEAVSLACDASESAEDVALDALEAAEPCYSSSMSDS